MSALRRLLKTTKNIEITKSRAFFAFVGVISLSLILSLISPYYYAASIILNVFRQLSIMAIVAVGVTCVIISGGIDLSVGSTLALFSVFATISLKKA